MSTLSCISPFNSEKIQPISRRSTELRVPRLEPIEAIVFSHLAVIELVQFGMTCSEMNRLIKEETFSASKRIRSARFLFHLLFAPGRSIHPSTRLMKQIGLYNISIKVTLEKIATSPHFTAFYINDFTLKYAMLFPGHIETIVRIWLQQDRPLTPKVKLNPFQRLKKIFEKPTQHWSEKITQEVDLCPILEIWATHQPEKMEEILQLAHSLNPSRMDKLYAISAFHLSKTDPEKAFSYVIEIVKTRGFYFFQRTAENIALELVKKYPAKHEEVFFALKEHFYSKCSNGSDARGFVSDFLVSWMINEPANYQKVLALIIKNQVYGSCLTADRCKLSSNVLIKWNKQAHFNQKLIKYVMDKRFFPSDKPGQSFENHCRGSTAQRLLVAWARDSDSFEPIFSYINGVKNILFLGAYDQFGNTVKKILSIWLEKDPDAFLGIWEYIYQNTELFTFYENHRPVYLAIYAIDFLKEWEAPLDNPQEKLKSWYSGPAPQFIYSAEMRYKWEIQCLTMDNGSLLTAWVEREPDRISEWLALLANENYFPADNLKPGIACNIIKKWVYAEPENIPFIIEYLYENTLLPDEKIRAQVIEFAAQQWILYTSPFAKILSEETTSSSLKPCVSENILQWIFQEEFSFESSSYFDKTISLSLATIGIDEGEQHLDETIKLFQVSLVCKESVLENAMAWIQDPNLYLKMLTN